MPVTSLLQAKKKRKLLNRLKKAGWAKQHVRRDVTPDGPRIYLCDVETGQLFIQALTQDAIRYVQENNTLAYADICSALGSLLGDIANGKVALDEEINGYLISAAALYIAGTQSYQLMRRSGIEPMQFIVLRYYDHSQQCHMLRPNPIMSTAILTPEQIEAQAQAVLEHDKQTHPERFKKADVLTFRLKTSQS